MTHPRKAELAFLTIADDKPILNLQFSEPGISRGRHVEQVEITPGQLANLCADGVKALWGQQ